MIKKTSNKTIHDTRYVMKKSMVMTMGIMLAALGAEKLADESPATDGKEYGNRRASVLKRQYTREELARIKKKRKKAKAAAKTRKINQRKAKKR